jgi:dipeptidyl aminopeptidase/acylaminoacyl peptidase
VANGEYHTVRSFAADGNERARAHLGVERVSWTAPDGLVIHGYLLKPADSVGPLPVIMNIHGGPVWHWKPTWVGRSGGLMLALLECGYAVFLPNPRGSSGRGREFVLPVIGDPGGIDAADLLSGLESLTKSGVADANRLGVTGGSYGGFMTAWLVTQDGRLAAAAPVCPHTNQMTEHLLGNIPHFVKKFFGDSFDTPNSRYLDRSPVMHASKARTPTLNICGALDRCTPPAEAAQFHAALLEYGVESVLVTYPKEGHGIRGYPAVIDYVARLVDWFDAHLRHC